MTPDPLLSRLRALPTLDFEPTKADALKREAHAELLRTTRRSRLGALWFDWLEPATVAAVILIYGAWGFSASTSTLIEASPAAAGSPRSADAAALKPHAP